MIKLCICDLSNHGNVDKYKCTQKGEIGWGMKTFEKQY